MVRRIRRKYWKPTSLTWLASATPLALGVFIATEPMHHLSEAVEAARNMTGGLTPYELINAGLIGIGIRGAIEQ